MGARKGNDAQSGKIPILWYALPSCTLLYHITLYCATKYSTNYAHRGGGHISVGQAAGLQSDESWQPFSDHCLNSPPTLAWLVGLCGGALKGRLLPMPASTCNDFTHWGGPASSDDILWAEPRTMPLVAPLQAVEVSRMAFEKYYRCSSFAPISMGVQPS